MKTAPNHEEGCCNPSARHRIGKVAGGASKAGKAVFATVKGDVHDIGKNIVSIDACMQQLSD